MEDRISKYPGRIRLVPVTGQEHVYDMAWADEPQVEGTGINKQNLLPDTTVTLLGLRQANPVPKDALEEMAIPLGSLRLTVADTLGDNFALANGQPYFPADYPALAEVQGYPSRNVEPATPVTSDLVPWGDDKVVHVNFYEFEVNDNRVDVTIYSFPDMTPITSKTFNLTTFYNIGPYALAVNGDNLIATCTYSSNTSGHGRFVLNLTTMVGLSYVGGSYNRLSPYILFLDDIAIWQGGEDYDFYVSKDKGVTVSTYSSGDVRYSHMVRVGSRYFLLYNNKIYYSDSTTSWMNLPTLNTGSNVIKRISEHNGFLYFCGLTGSTCNVYRVASGSLVPEVYFTVPFSVVNSSYYPRMTVTVGGRDNDGSVSMLIEAGASATQEATRAILYRDKVVQMDLSNAPEYVALTSENATYLYPRDNVVLSEGKLLAPALPTVSIAGANGFIRVK